MTSIMQAHDLIAKKMSVAKNISAMAMNQLLE